MNKRLVFIMAGGKGERFWPHSRLKKPKHLLPIVGNKPMLSQTIDRLTPLIPVEDIFVITNKEQLKGILENCPEILPHNIICEPIGRDTSAVVGLATLIAQEKDPNAVFAMLPADAVIHDTKNFSAAMQLAFETANANDVFVTIGIPPTFPATGYGYIKKAHPFSQNVFNVQKFVEKPNLQTAQQYLNEKNYYWNAGIFVWKATLISSAFKKLAPDIFSVFEKMKNELHSGFPLSDVLEKYFPLIPKISIDYAIIEKSSNVVMIEAPFDWDDVGEWTAIARHHTHDADGNVIKGNVIAENSKNNIIISSENHLLATLGIEDIIVVHTADATLICHKSKTQDIKKIISKLSQNDNLKHLS